MWIAMYSQQSYYCFIALFQYVYSVFRSYMFCFNVCLYAFHSVYVDDNR